MSHEASTTFVKFVKKNCKNSASHPGCSDYKYWRRMARQSLMLMKM